MTDEQALSMRSLGRPFAPARLKAWYKERQQRIIKMDKQHITLDNSQELLYTVYREEG